MALMSQTMQSHVRTLAPIVLGTASRLSPRGCLHAGPMPQRGTVIRITRYRPEGRYRESLKRSCAQRRLMCRPRPTAPPRGAKGCTLSASSSSWLECRKFATLIARTVLGGRGGEETWSLCWGEGRGNRRWPRCGAAAAPVLHVGSNASRPSSLVRHSCAHRLLRFPMRRCQYDRGTSGKTYGQMKTYLHRFEAFMDACLPVVLPIGPPFSIPGERVGDPHMARI